VRWTLRLALGAAVGLGCSWLSGRIAGELLRQRIHALGREVDAIRRTEWLRAWAVPGRRSNQAAAISLRATRILQTTHALDPDVLPTPGRVRALRDFLSGIEFLRSRAYFGARYLDSGRGAHLCGRISRIDDSLQPYSLTVPPEYDPEVSWPLVVLLHGHGWWRPFQGHPAPSWPGVFVLAPHGRGATDYMGVGEIDVVEAIGEVRRDYNIDPDRIFITGSSMGGTGSWHLGVHYPDLFAGIMPIAGNADYLAWTRRWGWNRTFFGRFDGLREWLQESRTPRAFAANLSNTPVYCIHGAADTVVPPEHARNMVAALRKAGAPVEYREFPRQGHGGFPGACVEEGRAWMCGHVRKQQPRRVHITAARLRHARAWWLRIVEFRKPGSLASIDARVTRPGRVEITTSNVAEFAIQQAPDLLPADMPLQVCVEGQEIGFRPARGKCAERRMRFVDGVGWRDLERLPSPSGGMRKKPWVEGPISEVLLQPFVLVRGTTAPSALMAEVWDREIRAFVDEWKRRNNAPCPVVDDVDCTAGIIRSRNLILFGGARDNAVSAAILPDLPLASVLYLLPDAPFDLNDSEAAERFLYRQRDRGMFYLHPNPQAPDRLVVVIMAGTPAAAWQVWGRFGNWFNWGVFDSDKYFDYAVYDRFTANPETFQVLGWFGSDWRVETGLARFAVPSVRMEMAPQQFPAYATAPSGVRGFSLLDLRPSRIDQMRGAVGWGRSFFGRPLPTPGLGIRAPSKIGFEIAGRFRRFTVTGALLDELENAHCRKRYDQEKLRFAVYGDDKLLAEAPDVTWKKPQVRLSADVTGVKTLRLECEVRGGPAWLHGSAAWLDPRLDP